MHLGITHHSDEAVIQSLEGIGESMSIKTELVQDGGLKIVN